MKPFLKWVGGKSLLIPQYETYFPTRYNRYFEPFLGSGAVFFHLQPKRAYLSDVNEELIITYQMIRRYAEEVIKQLKEMQTNHSKEHYYNIRKAQYTDGILRAARFIYLNKTCFNGLYRTNKKGLFNVPMGNYNNPNICDEETILNCSKVLYDKAFHTHVNEFDRVLDLVDIGDFVYLDPPYYPINNTSYTSYNGKKFNQDDFDTLVYKIFEIHKAGTKFMLSMSDCDYVRREYQLFNIVEISRKGSLNSDSSKRGKVKELLIMNY